MPNRPGKAKLQALWSELSTPVLIVAAFVLGAGGMWAIMRASSSGAPAKPVFKRVCAAAECGIAGPFAACA